MKELKKTIQHADGKADAFPLPILPVPTVAPAPIVDDEIAIEEPLPIDDSVVLMHDDDHVPSPSGGSGDIDVVAPSPERTYVAVFAQSVFAPALHPKLQAESWLYPALSPIQRWPLAAIRSELPA